MEPKFQTSFIPKKPIVASESISKTTTDFFLLISVVIFLGSIVLSAGVYGYKYILNKQIVTLQDSLAKSKEQFDQNFIGYVNRLNTRIETSKDLLNRHVSASTIFDFLSRHTLKNISYNSFTYSYESDGSIKVILNGVAQSYGTIALQSEEFGKQNQYIKSPIFSNLNPDQTSNVVFTLTALLDKNLISYSKNLGQGTLSQDQTGTNVQMNSSTSTTR